MTPFVNYDNAIKWGAIFVGEKLPSEYYIKIEHFILLCKKEHADSKKEGNIKEHESDPITAPLFCLICKWSVMSRIIFFGSSDYCSGILWQDRII